MCGKHRWRHWQTNCNAHTNTCERTLARPCSAIHACELRPLFCHAQRVSMLHDASMYIGTQKGTACCTSPVRHVASCYQALSSTCRAPSAEQACAYSHSGSCCTRRRFVHTQTCALPAPCTPNLHSPRQHLPLRRITCSPIRVYSTIGARDILQGGNARYTLFSISASACKRCSCLHFCLHTLRLRCRAQRARVQNSRTRAARPWHDVLETYRDAQCCTS